MTDRLSTYLNDHLAGAKFAIELLERLRDSHPDAPLGHLAAKMVDEITNDRATLQDLCETVGGNESTLKEVGAWLAERTARWKLRLGNDLDLGEFESLEMLSLGVLGKLKLWTALDAIAPSDSRLKDLDLKTLIHRAQAQHDELEAHRIAAAQECLLRQS